MFGKTTHVSETLHIPRGILGARNHIQICTAAHHDAFDKPVRHHWYMSTTQQPTQDLNPEPSDGISIRIIVGT